MTRKVNINSLEIDGIDMSDYPDFCDTFFSYGEWEDGTPMTDEELDAFQNDNSQLLYELTMNSLY